MTLAVVTIAPLGSTTKPLAEARTGFQVLWMIPMWTPDGSPCLAVLDQGDVDQCARLDEDDPWRGALDGCRVGVGHCVRCSTSDDNPQRHRSGDQQTSAEPMTIHIALRTTEWAGSRVPATSHRPWKTHADAVNGSSGPSCRAQAVLAPARRGLRFLQQRDRRPSRSGFSWRQPRAATRPASESGRRRRCATSASRSRSGRAFRYSPRKTRSRDWPRSVTAAPARRPARAATSDRWAANPPRSRAGSAAQAASRSKTPLRGPSNRTSDGVRSPWAGQSGNGLRRERPAPAPSRRPAPRGQCGRVRVPRPRARAARCPARRSGCGPARRTPHLAGPARGVSGRAAPRLSGAQPASALSAVSAVAPSDGCPPATYRTSVRQQRGARQRLQERQPQPG